MVCPPGLGGECFIKTTCDTSPAPTVAIPPPLPISVSPTSPLLPSPICSATTPEYCAKPLPAPAPLTPPPLSVSVPLYQQMNNPLNPISPISPLAPRVTKSQQNNPLSLADLLAILNSQDSTNEDAAQDSSQTQLVKPATKGKMLVKGVGLALSLDNFIKPGIRQPSLFPEQNITQEIPKEMLLHSQVIMGLLTVPPLVQAPIKEELDLEQ